MTRQNRVTPRSGIIAAPGRGLLMGNRGCLHDGAGQIVRHWRGRLWIACQTDFRGRRLALMQPGRYTELFFLDEAVAFAAGHRPCAECRRTDYEAFQAAWARAGLPAVAGASELDRHLHAARLPLDRALPLSDLAALPAGAFVSVDGRDCLWSAGKLRPWRPDGYAPALPLPATTVVNVLTPEPFLRVLAAGYRPILHLTAGQGQS